MIKIVLDDSCSREDFDRFCYKQDWDLEAIIDANPDTSQPDQTISRDPETGVRIVYTEDYLIDLRYVILDGEDKSVEKVANTMYAARDIKVVSKDRIFHSVKDPSSPEELVLGLRWLAVVAPANFDQSYFDMFRIGLEHEDSAVRHAAIQVVSYPGWEVFRDVAKRMKEHDPDPYVRGAAASLLRAFASVGKKTTKRARRGQPGRSKPKGKRG